MSKVTMRRPDARAMAQLLAEQTQTAAGLILRLAWRQGLTREEIQRLTWNDVDFSAHQLRLPDRTIPLETETEGCLRRQAERPDPPTPFVVVSDRRRQQMPPESISRLARKTLDRAGLGGISLMDLRHDFIIRHLESHDWPYVARISGIAVPTLYAVFSDYLPEGRQKDSLPRREVDGFLMWKLLQAEGSSPVGLALWMGWKLGMQVREMTALTWDQVDLDRGLLRLPDREIPMGSRLSRLLGDVCDHRKDPAQDRVLLTPGTGKPMDLARLSTVIRTALIRGGLEQVNLRNLHTWVRQGDRAQLLMAQAEEQGWLTREAVMERLGVSKSTARQYLLELREAGRLVRVGTRYYPAGAVADPDDHLDIIRAYLQEHGTGRRQDFIRLLGLEPEQGTLLLRRLTDRGELVLTGRHYTLPEQEK
mgnify:CR=1 FL=1